MAAEAAAKGNAAMRTSDYAAAIRHFSDAIALDPDNPILYAARSAAYASLKQWSFALSDAKKTARLNFGWPKSHLMVGIASLGSGRFDMALKASERGLSLDPNDVHLKHLYQKAKAEEEARRKIGLQKAPGGDQADKTTLSLEIKEPDGKDSHRVEDTAGPGEQVTAELQIVRCTEQLESNPEVPQLYNERSVCYMKLGKFHEALKDADKCIELDPRLWTGYDTKGQILIHMKDYNAAGKTYIAGLNLTENYEELMEAFGRFLQQLEDVFTESKPG